MAEEVDYIKLAQSMGVDESEIPEPETEQPEDVAEVEVIEYGDGE